MPAMDEDDDMAQLQAKRDRILAMPGRVAWVKLARLNRSAKIFRGNAKALLDHLRRMDDDLDHMLATTRDLQAFGEFLDETERHLHNYVAAAQTRVEHFRRLSRNDMPEGFREEYERRVDQEFATSPLHNFVTDLRNFVLHWRLPVQSATESWGADGWSFQVMLDSADLLRWDKWSSQARQYIEGSGESVDLDATVASYTNKIVTFDRWVAEGFIREHMEEIESYLGAERQYRARLRQLGLLNDPETP
jgi:hypothetical protein